MFPYLLAPAEKAVMALSEDASYLDHSWRVISEPLRR